MASEKDLIQSDIEGYLARYQNKELLRFVAVGSVDDGKSTLIGRLLFDTGSVYQDQLEAVRKATHMAGTEIDLSLLTDGLAAEREQGITIDVAYRYFTTDKRKFIIADTPGHVQYTRNMVTGASTANVAIILIDARLGVLQQSRRHAYIASLLGIPHLAVCVNKMDLVAFDRAIFERIRAEFTAFTKGLAFTGVTFFPISALTGANCVHKSDKTPWYEGATVLEFLESVPVADKRDFEHLRYPVQYVARPNLDYRGFAGRIASGVVRKGDAVTVLPSRQSSRVKAIDTLDKELTLAFAPQSITIRLEDEIDVSRGCMLVHSGDLPAVTRTFDAHLVWMQSEPLDLGRTYLLKHTTQTVRADVDRVHGRRDMDSLEEVPAETLTLNEIGRVTITAHRELFLDPYDKNRETGSFILIDTISNGTVAAGMVAATNQAGATSPDTAGTTPGASAPGSQVSDDERRARFGASGAIVLLASDTPSRALAAAYAAERALFDLGVTSVVVDRRVGAGALTAAEALKNAGILAIVPATRGHKQAAHDIVVDLDAAAGHGAGHDTGRGADEVIAALRGGNWIAPSRTRS
ncbi:MAG TPA: sulfate adenylyltransferase subunit CysN [Polyangiaceae bacterium]|jgi:bifunctional enzyme CysN/CysC|nr:sulfate adenylyltransferase subunit CysN [Polyangiaceae bacterium]